MTYQIDFLKLIKYILKRIWIVILCAAIGFGAMYYKAAYRTTDTYTAKGTMYVYNGNPNLVNYQYTTMSDISTAVALVDTYSVIIKSNRVMDVVRESLLPRQLTNTQIASTLTMGSVEDTGVMRVSCTTTDPELSMDICNAVLDVAPSEIIRVIGAGSAERIDYAELPTSPNGKGTLTKGMTGGLIGAVLAAGVLFLLFIMNRKISDNKDLTDNYKIPLLSCIPRQHEKEKRNGYLINERSNSELLSAYGKLRMNLFFAMRDKTKVILVSSAVPGESKSTVASNLAVSFAMDNKHVLLIDGDMRKPTQAEIFELSEPEGGLSDLLVPNGDKKGVINSDVRKNLDVLTAGTIPPNPSELLNSTEMRDLLTAASQQYDVIILDLPPINIVSDALVLSDTGAGMLFVTRCGYSDHREVRKALESAEMTGTNLLGLVLTRANKTSDGYYRYGYYKKYYGYYDATNPSKHKKHKHSKYSD